MTIGTRIAQKRKEHHWSQEALGDLLGVSRQAIYKWESDTALPEIEKLLALSKLFGVSVDWLLGAAAQDAPQEAVPQEELTDAQLHMVEEIVSRYLAAQSRPAKRRRWPWVLAAAVVLVVGVRLFGRLDQMNNQYRNLQNAMNNLQYSVNNQISGITGRVEDILKAQNHLTAEYGTQLLDIDGFTATFSMRAVPKTFTEGLQAVFLVDNGQGVLEIAAQRQENGAYSAEEKVALTDRIALSVVFIEPDGTRQTQLLDIYDYLCSGTLLELQTDAFELYGLEVADGKLVTDREIYATIANPDSRKLVGKELVSAAEIKMGLFRNQQLVAWAEPCDKPSTYHGFEGQQFYRLPVEQLTDLTDDDRIVVGALVTDTLGRQYMRCDIPYEIWLFEDGKRELTYASDGVYDPDLSAWTLTTGPLYETTTPIGKAE